MKLFLKVTQIASIFTIILLGYISTASAASTYYISPSGNDASGSGSLGSPWKTLAKACGSTSFGDVIHVGAGTYLENEQCVLAPGVSIEGEGVSSVIKSTINDDWTPIILASSPEGTNGDQHISNIKLDGQNLSTFWAIHIAGRSNVSVHDTTIVNFKDRGIIFAGRTDAEEAAPSIYAKGNSYYNNICSNSAAYNTSNGVYGRGCLNIGGQEGMLIYNNTITQNQRPEGYNGWPIKGWNDGHLRGVKIYNNTIVKKPYGGTYPGESGWDFAIELFNISGVEIYGNTIQGSIDTNHQIKGSYPYSVWIHDNTISQPTLNANFESGIILEFSTDTAIIEKNILNNVSTGVQFNTRDRSVVSNIIIRNNLMTNIGRATGDGNNGGAIIFITETTHNATLSKINIYNNTILAAPGNAPWEGIEFGDAISGTGGSASNINIKNNIVSGFKNSWLRANTPTHTNQLVVTHNNIYNNANDNMPLWPGGNPTNYTYANNLSVDPLFVGGSNYSLQATSPLINVGTNVGLPYNGSAPDIGYLESGSTVVNPPIDNGGGGGGNSCPSGTTGTYPNCTPIIVPPSGNSNDLYFVNVGNLNVRLAKSPSSKRITSIRKKAIVTVLEVDNTSGWFKIKTTAGVVGYVKSKHLQQLVVAGGKGIVSSGRVNLRQAESTKSASLQKLNPSDILDILSVSTTTSWAKVKTASGATGFVNKFLLKVIQ